MSIDIQHFTSPLENEKFEPMVRVRCTECGRESKVWEKGKLHLALSLTDEAQMIFAQFHSTNRCAPPLSR